MFFLGTVFGGGRHTMDTTPAEFGKEEKVTVSGCVADDLFISSADLSGVTEIPQTWDYYTILHALFNGTLLAGNVDFYVDNVDFFRIKRRKANDSKWLTLHEVVVNNADDMNINFVDIAARSKETYSYSIVPVIGGTEGNLYSNEITTDFCGLIISDRQTTYGTWLDIDIEHGRNRPVSVVSTLNRKYPYVIYNGAGNFDSGRISAMFAERDAVRDDWDFEGSHAFREGLQDFLCNGEAKIIKCDDGRMWLAAVSSQEVSNSVSGHEYAVVTSFEFTEVGDCEDADDLRANNLTGDEVV